MTNVDSHGDRYDPSTDSPRLPERPGPWYQSATGDRIWPLEPRAADVRLLDIARGLANECRFGRMMGKRGQWYSVAEHSVLVAHHVGILFPDEGWMPEALLHDGGEFTGFGDVPRPLKHDPSIRPIVDRVEDPWTIAIYEAFGVTSTSASRAAIKHVDNLLAYEERAAVTRNPALYARPYPAGVEPLRAAIRCLQPRYAEVDFLYAVARLFPAFAKEADRLIRFEDVWL